MRLLVWPSSSRSSLDLSGTTRGVVVGDAHKMLRTALSVVWLASLHIVGLLLFCRGFLLTRTVLDNVSSRTGQEPPARFDKAVILIIDALRYDFVSRQDNSSLPYHNHYTVLEETAQRVPDRAFLTPFIADPPTTTLQRLKGLTTGSLPTFIDAGSNFAGTEILEDNWISQLRSAGKRLAFVGDDTWQSLFPNVFQPGLNRPFESFNVWDLDTVDHGAEKHLFEWLHPDTKGDWDVLIAHALGVDHAGHRYGPNHPEMSRKLDEMDDWTRRLVDLVDQEEDVLLIVMGDHGMNAQGDHGGDSELELWSTLWMYSSRPDAFGTSTQSRVRQIDLVPTMSRLLGLPIPFNNLGSPIKQCFPNDHDEALDATTAQIKTYIDAYRTHSDEIGSAIDRVQDHNGEDYHRAVLEIFSQKWAQYDLRYIALGLLMFVIAMASNVAAIYGHPLPIGQIAVMLSSITTIYDIAPLATVMAASAQASIELLRTREVLRASPWIVFAIAHCAIFGSNSFIIFEDRVVLLLVNSVTLILAGSAIVRGRWRAFVSLLLVAGLSRVAAEIRLCREEQAGRCISNFYSAEGSGSSSSSATILLASMAVALPWASNLVASLMDVRHGKSKYFRDYYLPTAIAASALYWQWDRLDIYPEARLALARTIICSSLVGAVTIWWFRPLPILFIVDAEAKVEVRGLLNAAPAAMAQVTLSIGAALILIAKPLGGVSLSILLCQLQLLMLSAETVPTSLLGLLAHQHFFTTGHQMALPFIQWDVAFLIAKTVVYPWSPLIVAANAFSAFVIVTLLASALVTSDRLLQTRLFSLQLYATALLFTSAALCTHFRRHLMVWKIFAPRFMCAAVALLTVDAAALVAVVFLWRIGSKLRALKELVGGLEVRRRRTS